MLQDGYKPGPRARRRAAAAWAAWAAGSLVAASILPAMPPSWWWSLALLAAAIGGTFRAVRPLGLPALAFSLFCLSGGWFTHRILTPEPGPPTEAILHVRAMVASPPHAAPAPRGVLDRFARQGPRQWFLADLRSRETDAGEQPAQGRVSVWVAGEEELDVHPGDIVRLTGRFAPVAAALNPGQPDRVRWARQEGRVGALSLTDASLIRPGTPVSTVESVHAVIRRGLWAFRDRASGALRAATAGSPPERRALVLALLLGEADPALDETNAEFSRLGVVHILSISGLHVSTMAGFVAFLVRLLGERGRWQTALLAAPILAYLVLTPAQAPVMRAGVMALAFLAAELASRRYDPATILIWTSLAILIWRPMDLWSLGYQLSCGMTLALLWIGPRVHDRLWGSRVILPGAWRRWTVRGAAVGALKASIGVSLLCWSLSTPAVWRHTGVLSFIAVVASVLLAPIFAGLMYTAFAALMIGLVAPPLASLAGWLIGLFAALALGTSSWLDRIPGGSAIGPPLPAWSAVVATLVILWWWMRGSRSSPVAWCVACVGVIVVAAGVAARTRLPHDVTLRIDTLAVGDGACHLMRSGSETLVWDCGSLRPGVGVRELPSAMRALGVTRARTAILSHGDLDHLSAFPEVAGTLGVTRLLVAPRTLERAKRAPTGPVSVLLDLIRSRGIEIIPVVAGDALTFGEVRLTFLSPPPGAAWPEENDHSLVARLDRAEAPAPQALALFTGDIQAAAIASLRDRFPNLRARWVEAPHHGSVRPEAAAWVYALAPQAVAQSTGPRRLWTRGDPGERVWADVLNSSRWLSTASSGALRADFTAAGELRVAPLPR